MFLTNNPFSDHGPSKQVLSEAIKYHIPEDIPANERTAFHGAAAAAAKAGKKSFNFGGKTHPVTMKKDTANKIADQKEAVTIDNERMKTVKHNQAMTNLKRLDKKHSGKDHADHMKVRMAVDKAGQTLNKHGAHSDQYKTAYATAKHLSNKHAQKESTMTFREKLLSLYEGDRKSHYKSATEPEGMHDKMKSSKGAMDMVNTPKEVAADGKKAADDNAAKSAEKKMNKAKKRSGGDNIDKGDTKIVPGGTPVKEPSMKNEAYDKTNKATMHVKDAGVEKEDHPFIRKDVAKTGAKVKFHSDGGISYHGSDHQIAKALKQHHPDDHKELGNLNYHKSGQHDKDYGSHGSHVYTNHSAKTKKEEYGMFGKKVSDSLLKAISIVDNYTHEFDVDSEKNAHTMVKKAKAAGMKAKIHTMKGPGGGNPVVHLGYKDTDHMHKFIKKNYDDSYEKSDLNIHKM